jgi:hypothetical protein
MAVADVILEALIGRVEGFADGHGEILAGLPVDRDLRARDADDDAHPDASAKGMAAGTVDSHAAFLDPIEEMAQLLGSLVDVFRQVRGQESVRIHEMNSNRHPSSDHCFTRTSGF